MQLSSRLRQTTLGDLLAVLHRAGASGVLELIEPHARHSIHLRRGYVQAVETDGSSVRLGDVAARLRGIARPLVERARMFGHARGMRIGQALIATNAISPGDLDDLLAAQQRQRLERLYSLPDAEVRFRVARPLPAGASEQSPLNPRDVFYGRARRATRVAPVSRTEGTRTRFDANALAVMGLNASANFDEIRKRFKQLVLELHPDRVGAGQQTAERSARLLSVLEAYRKLSR